MWYSKSYSCLYMLTLFMVYGCSATNEPLGLRADVYVIYQEGVNRQAVDYLYHHLQKRSNDKQVVFLKTKEDKRASNGTQKHIYFQIEEQQVEDYCIKHSKDVLRITVKDSKTMEWITYQLIESIAQVDKRFNASDLPPAILNFESQCASYDFGYREPYFRGNLLPDQSGVAGNHNVELDWGIWGHNLAKAIADHTATSVYANVDGKLNKEQFCFTSPVLKQVIATYILDHFGSGEKQGYRFVIAPQDNDFICSCIKCKALNKGAEDASESVTQLINELARQFPKHQFFSLLYRSAKRLPQANLEKNVGVFISTIDLPKGIDLAVIEKDNVKVQRFAEEVKQWKTKTKQVYLWDYSANFDDYLSPLPTLYGLQKQLKFFKAIGVQGIFLNASGYDYSSFDDVKNYVSGALMKDVLLSVDDLVQKYFQKYYPQSASFLIPYYLKSERAYEQKNKAYPLYGSMQDMLNTYVSEDDFVLFYKQVKQAAENTTGTEQRLLRQLYTALTFTRMQLAYTKGSSANGVMIKQQNQTVFTDDAKAWCSILKEANKYGITQYKEVGGSLEKYINSWESLLQKPVYRNFIMDKQIKVLSKTDDGFENSNLLNNGLRGMSVDYHLGWYINSIDDLHLSFDTGDIQGNKTINIAFLVLDKHRFKAPEYVELWADDVLIKKIDSQSFKKEENIAWCQAEVNFNAITTMRIKAIKPAGKRVAIACDEIQITNQIEQ